MNLQKNPNLRCSNMMEFQVHPSSIVDSTAILQKNCKIGPYAIIEEGVTLGENCEIDAHAIIKKHTVLENNVRVGHFAIVGGDPQHLTFDPSVKSNVYICAETRIGEGVTIHRSIYPNGVTKIGSKSFLMGYSHVAHDGNLGKEVILANGALLGGHVSIGDFTFVGGGAGIHQFIRIGEEVMIGGLAEVSKDVPPFVTISGRNTAYGLNLVGIKRRNISSDECKVLKQAYRSILMKGGNPSVHAQKFLDENKVSNRNKASKFAEFFLTKNRGFIKSKSSRY